MKKGFTLIELLAVIVIIGVIALIAVPAVMSSILESKEKLYTTQVQNIELAAKKWATDNRNELDSEYLNASFVPVEMLQSLNYLAKDKLQNPKTGELMKGCVAVTYDMKNKLYTYKYDDTNPSCTKKDTHGYYYHKNTNNIWEKDLSNQRQSIFSYLVGEDSANVVVMGPGLYDMEDRYVFRGNVNNNYVKLDGTYYRILSLDKTNKTMKLISTTNNGSSVWGTTDNNSFNVSTLYKVALNISLYPSITNKNIKWNIGKIEDTNNLNLNAVKTYEGKTKIVSEVGLISMSEYMEASTNADCSNGLLASCSLENYLDMADSWTTTTTENSVAYVDTIKGLSYENDLVNAHHNIYRVVNIMPMKKSGTGTYYDPFIISSNES